MASDDVLERARNFTSSPKRYLAFKEIDAAAIDLVVALSAEVRELRRDKARLDALETIIATRKIVGGPWEGCLSNTRAISSHSLRDLADAAMGGED